MSPNSPLVSVIIPTYNTDAFVGEAIESILKQTWQNLELIVINDNSSDKTAEVIESYQDPRLRIIHHETNLGVSAARNSGIQASQGEFIALLDSDDVAVSNRLEVQMDFLQKHTHIGMVGGGVTFFGPAAYEFPIKGIFPPFDHHHIQAQMLFNASFNNTTMLYRKVALDSVWDNSQNFYYNPLYRSAEDYDLAARILEKWKASNLPKVLTHKRQLFGSACRHPDNRPVSLSVQFELISKLHLHLSQDEADLQYKLAFFTDDEFKDNFTINELPELRLWMKQLLKANQKYGYFEQAALRNVFWFRWFGLCKRYAPGQKNLLLSPPCFPTITRIQHLQYFISKTMTWMLK